MSYELPKTQPFHNLTRNQNTINYPIPNIHCFELTFRIDLLLKVSFIFLFSDNGNLSIGVMKNLLLLSNNKS